MYRWQINIWKDAQHHLSLWNCKLKQSINIGTLTVTNIPYWHEILIKVKVVMGYIMGYMGTFCTTFIIF